MQNFFNYYKTQAARIFDANNAYKFGINNTIKKKNEKVTKIVIIFTIGFILRWFINDLFHVNVFKHYTEYISIAYYSIMAILAGMIQEITNVLFHVIDGAKIPMQGLDTHPGFKEKSGTKINTRKGLVNTMDNSTGNSGGVGSSTANNNSGGVGGNNGGESSSSGGRGSSSNSTGHATGIVRDTRTGLITELRARPVNAMSFTQIMNPTILEDATNIIKPLDKESFTNVQQVLLDERDAFQSQNPQPRGAVRLKHLGYDFRPNKSSGSVLWELNILKATDPGFKDLKGDSNVDKIIYSDKEAHTGLKKLGRAKKED